MQISEVRNLFIEYFTVLRMSAYQFVPLTCECTPVRVCLGTSEYS